MELNLTSILTDRDKITNADRITTANVCALLFNAIQDKPAETQLLGLAAAFLLMARATGVPAQEAFTAVTNLMYDAMHPDGVEHRFAAMLYHLETEVLA